MENCSKSVHCNNNNSRHPQQQQHTTPSMMRTNKQKHNHTHINNHNYYLRHIDSLFLLLTLIFGSNIISSSMNKNLFVNGAITGTELEALESEVETNRNKWVTTFDTFDLSQTYYFEYSKHLSLINSTTHCRSQVMIINVESDNITSVSFAQGNSYAFRTYCNNDTELYNTVLEFDEYTTIMHLFEAIPELASIFDTISVVYHDTYGYPLVMYGTWDNGQEQMQFITHCLKIEGISSSSDSYQCVEDYIATCVDAQGGFNDRFSSEYGMLPFLFFFFFLNWMLVSLNSLINSIC